ncbi:type II toxin-antitoxin system RelE/ParE family toxin [Devosia rhizoryzae]|uniref:Type II toxin-antitoxin system RelE/ParE family toxin n=1 Tax=Devosia rhizoryzae TaxID=2774137 RepID=A0ABX7CEN9_9HYPH|nr:type II toxin-antitoxin system RelE/ParE family toxin [Devosia rhizoryzae]QQR41292.1 type II toxin-antitoxin system RelE/ParE family toxin [Devosia rhizoryzae]
MRVRLSLLAESDIEAIADYIAQDSPKRALSFTSELRSACMGLGEAPLRFALLEVARHRGYRRRIHGNYVIVYSVGAEVTIVRVVSAAADLQAIFNA